MYISKVDLLYTQFLKALVKTQDLCTYRYVYRTVCTCIHSRVLSLTNSLVLCRRSVTSVTWWM